MSTGHQQRVRIKPGWEGAGRKGVRHAEVNVQQPWSVVVWDDEEDPDCFKSAGLEEIA